MDSSITLSNGKLMPVIGLGTWQIDGSDVGRCVKAAIDAGYRHIDTAFLYKNETEIGEALQRAFKDGKVKREDMFIVTKLPPNGNRKDLVKYFFNKSLAALQLDYVDLYLIHSPVSSKKIEDDFEAFPLKDGKLDTEEVDLVETWKVMEELVNEGLARAIGLSNFNSVQIKRIYDNARIKPVNLQVECHACLSQIPLQELCKSLNISFTAYSPLGSPALVEFAKNKYKVEMEDTRPHLLSDPLITKLAKKYNKTTAQILLRNLVQRGMIVIPKSSSPTRISENIKIFDFTLSEEDMDAVHSINKDLRFFNFDFFKGATEHPEYPYNIPF